MAGTVVQLYLEKKKTVLAQRRGFETIPSKIKTTEE